MLSPRLRRVLGISAVLLATLALLVGAAFLARHELLRLYEDLPPFSHRSGDSQLEHVAMRDGVGLATQLFLPEGTGPWPTVLIRSPYDRLEIATLSWCERLVRYGYACVHQTVRGRGESGGDWEPLRNEEKDGRDTLDWLVAQPFQDGNLALLGPSYLAAVQWAVANDLPPEVKTFIPSVFTTNLYESVYQAGIFRHEAFTAWPTMMPRRGDPPDEAGNRYQQAIRHRPHIEIDEVHLGGRLPWYREWVSSPGRGMALWQEDENQRLLATPEAVEVPVLFIGGWYDVFFGPQMTDWQRLASRPISRFVVGPWTHIGSSGPAMEFPDDEGGLMQWELTLDWLGHHLRGEPLGQPLGVTTYVMGENRWVTRASWPPPSDDLRLYLHDPKAARNCTGGSLGPEPPTQPQQVHYRYDPQDPVPTRGGSGMLAFILPGFDGAPAGNVWQEGLCERQDVLSFETEPLNEPLPLAGSAKVVLSVASDAADTAFNAKLVEVRADGRAVNIRDAITSLAYRNGSTHPQPYTPGNTLRIEIPLWPIEWTVAAGSRLRLDISSSDFPKFHAHSNLEGPWALQDHDVVARQTLLTDPAAPSYVDLPVRATVDEPEPTPR
ncbi:CocE/NonD family hydrolase [Myxococcota bacterium]|nr:CocE/NonD family hydrolase [Myxococcota bacterium]